MCWKWEYVIVFAGFICYQTNLIKNKRLRCCYCKNKWFIYLKKNHLLTILEKDNKLIRFLWKLQLWLFLVWLFNWRFGTNFRSQNSIKNWVKNEFSNGNRTKCGASLISSVQIVLPNHTTSHVNPSNRKKKKRMLNLTTNHFDLLKTKQCIGCCWKQCSPKVKSVNNRDNKNNL